MQPLAHGVRHAIEQRQQLETARDADDDHIGAAD